MQLLGSCATVFGLGFIYFISAIPAGAALHLPVWFAAICAWLGYSTGGLVVILAGAPLRARLMRRFKIQPHPENPSFILRVWSRFGLPAMGLLAPVTIGPQAGALLGLALNVKKLPLALALSLGALPSAAVFAALTHLGVNLVK